MATRRRAQPVKRVAAKAKSAKAKPAKAKPTTRKPAAKKKRARVSTHPVKHRTPETLALLERLRRICMALPDVTEVVAWGEPTWRRGKIFAMTDTYHHGSAHFSVHIPAPPGAQEALIDAEPDRFFKPPYTGGKGWIAIVLDTKPDWDMVASLVRTAYDLVAPAPRRR
ncbi:MAG TPA: MmcQ/YjbR family DNA-binding protein [Kofleriaceae bacterium]|jgi:hypothetical protein